MGRELQAIIDERSAFYDTPGKRRVRERLIALAVATGCKTWAELWGGGTSARLATEAGLVVTSAERDRSLHEAAAYDAERHGYALFAGSARLMKTDHDFWFADFTQTAAQETARELHALARRTGKILAVALSPDHQKDELLAGAMASATVVAWLVAVTGLACDYLERYTRNEYGQWMWLAILIADRSRTHRGFDPTAVASSIRRRGWWGANLKNNPRRLLYPRRTGYTDSEAAYKRKYYEANRATLLAKVHERRYSSPEAHAATKARQRAWHAARLADMTDAERARRRAKLREYQRAYRARPEVRARLIEYKRQWRARSEAA